MQTKEHWYFSKGYFIPQFQTKLKSGSQACKECKDQEKQTPSSLLSPRCSLQGKRQVIFWTLYLKPTCFSEITQEEANIKIRLRKSTKDIQNQKDTVYGNSALLKSKVLERNICNRNTTQIDVYCKNEKDSTRKIRPTDLEKCFFFKLLVQAQKCLTVKLKS